MDQPHSSNNVASATTAEQDRRTASQRRVNLIWEYTQACIAVVVVLGNIAYAFATFFGTANGQSEALMSNAFFLVIGFYFGRTNHTRIGDVRGQQLDDR